MADMAESVLGWMNLLDENIPDRQRQTGRIGIYWRLAARVS